MAACSLFEEDVVCHVTPDNSYIYGLVMENSETVSSDEEDPPDDSCSRGCVKIAWHPKGKESYNTPENKVLLVDRSLMVADIVRRLVPGQQTQCGVMQDIRVMCHLQITGSDKYIYNVDSKLLSPCIQLQKFENGYVTMDNWLGRVEEVIESIVLLLPDGARCEMKDADAAYLEDVSEKRPETVTFNEEFYYPGQLLKGDICNLHTATWLNSTLLYNSKNTTKRDTFYATVEAVKIVYISVYWICCGYSKASMDAPSQAMPPPRVEGDDLNRLQVVDSFEHCVVKLGDKMYYTIKEEDVVETQPPKNHFVPFAAQQLSRERLAEVTHKPEDLFNNRFSNKPHKAHKKGAASASSSNATATTVASSVSASSLPDGAVGESKPMETGDTTQEKEENTEQNPTASEQNDTGKGEGDPEADMDADDEYEDIEDKKEEESDEESLSSSASVPKRRRRDRGIAMSVKSLRKASRRARRSRPVMEINTRPGSRVATEVCYTFSTATVLWQDGTVEENIPSVELYPVHHLDELEYFPGSFVVDSKAPSTSSEYGVVTSCNRFERTCQIKWFHPYEVGKSTFPTEVIKESEVSVYDIQDHPDYKFRPGNNVIRVSGFEDMHQTLQAVGQVIRLDPTGTVFVHWTDNTYTSSYPQDLYIVWDMSDYSNSSSDIESTSSEEYDSSDGLSDTPSWETEEEEWKLDGESVEGSHSEGEKCEAAKEDKGADPPFRDMAEESLVEIKQTMHTIGSSFEAISEGYSALTSQTLDSVVSEEESRTSLIRCLKKVLKTYRSWVKFERESKIERESGVSAVVAGFIFSIKYGVKREKSNKIKQHLAHVFESTNKGLLDQSREMKKPDMGTDSSDSDESSVVRTARQCSEASDPTVTKCKAKGDAGTPEEVDVSSVVASSDGASGTVKNGSPQEAQEDLSSRLAAASIEEKKAEDAAENKAPDDGTGACDAVNNGRPPVESDAEEDSSSKLAAARVEKKKAEDTVGKKAQDSEDLANPNPPEGQRENADNWIDQEKVFKFVEMVNEKLLCIQDSIDNLQKLLCLAHPKYGAVTQVAVEEEPREKKAKGKVERDSGPAEEKEGEAGIEELTGSGVDVRADNLEACEKASGSSVEGKPPVMVNGIYGDEDDIVDPPGVVLPQGFFMCNSAPACHSYSSKTCMPSNLKKFYSTIRKELKLLRTSLPDGIIVKGFEDRMDLFSVLIDGPVDTPYEDGMFLFDIMLPHNYPLSPPLFHYLSFASDRLNPNLYVDGKVCVSLLGTWSGKGMEVWTDKSNLLQVLVSIQGLILVDEPYYNEAGYERQRGHQIALENSRMYNEMALLRLVESMTTLCERVPEPFEQEVQERLKKNGYRMITRLRKWVSMSEKMGQQQQQPGAVTPGSEEQGAEGGVDTQCSEDSGGGGAGCASAVDSAPLSEHTEETGESKWCEDQPPPGHPRFPLLPISKGFRLTLQKSITQLELALNALQTRMLAGCEGASCEQSDAAAS